MRTTRALALLTALALAACAGDADEADMGAMDDTASVGVETTDDPDVSPAGDATGMPEGYALRLDHGGASPSDFQVSDDGGLHVRTGPAGILYDEEDAVSSGDYSVSGTFTEIGAPPNHREAFGLFIGGQDLQGEGQRYTYFLVRADGRYLIKRRAGDDTSNVSEGWVESDAVSAGAEGGDYTNRLEVAVRGDQVHFSINGQEVAAVPASEVDAYGVAGVRVNHNLNVRVEDFELSA